MMPKAKITLVNLFTLLLVVLFTVVVAAPVEAQTPTPVNPVYIYFFWGEGCPHCAKAKPFLEYLASKYPQIVFNSYEIYYDQQNQTKFLLMAEEYGIDQLAVPTIFIGPYHVQGYSEELDASIEEVVNVCIKDGCVDPGNGVIKNAVSYAPTRTPTFSPFSSQNPTLEKTPEPIGSGGNAISSSSNLNQSVELKLPFFGTVNLASKSAIFSTAIIALVDGFNPCSLWVLTMLLALTLHTGSRKKVFVIGFVFLTVTAAIYALFIAGLFSVLSISSFMGWIRILVALIALVFAIVNIKDYFWYKEGLSFTISDEKKPGIFRRIRQLIDNSNSFAGLVGGTIALAAGVSLVEFSCTAGFPVIWTNILTSLNIKGLAFILLLVLYMIIYQLDEMIIFFSSIITLKTSRIEEKHGRILKLISGVLMFTLAVVMLVKPELMNSLGSSLAIFGSAIIATLAVVVIHQIILPKAGIRIGNTEIGKKRE